jgi:hypothetical protein
MQLRRDPDSGKLVLDDPYFEKLQALPDPEASDEPASQSAATRTA